MRIVFFGSPPFALPTLEAVLAAGHRVPLVVSQPGKPVGRKGDVTDPPVAARAKSLGIHVFQPATLKDDAALPRLAEASADVFVVVAYGKILAQRVLDLPRLGCLNVHGSLLPRWRGASPVQAAILAGDAFTGVSIMKMDAGMDTGPVYAARETRIGDEETAEELGARLAQMGADALVETLYFLEGEKGRGKGERSAETGAPSSTAGQFFSEGELPGATAPLMPRGIAGAGGTAPHPPSQKIFLPPVPQNDSLATYCPKIAREDGRVDWSRPGLELARRARAFTPWPGLFTFRRDMRLKLSGLSPVPREAFDARGGRETPGVLLEAGPRVVVACGEGAVSVATLQAEGRKPLPAAEFVRGERVAPGERWG
ncbi:MAG: methionyl-tRNA formyltransferase [Acidobacteriota bacterium]